MSDPKRPITINLDGHGVGSLKLGDADLSHETLAAEIRIRAGRVPEVMVEMRPGRLAIEAEAEVRVDRATSAALIELGWTPPGGHVPRLSEPEALEYLKARFEAAQAGPSQIAAESTVEAFVLTWHPISVSDDGMSVTVGEPGQKVKLDVNQGWAGTPQAVASEVSAAVAAMVDLVGKVIQDSAEARSDAPARPGGTTGAS